MRLKNYSNFCWSGIVIKYLLNLIFLHSLWQRQVACWGCGASGHLGVLRRTDVGLRGHWEQQHLSPEKSRCSRPFPGGMFGRGAERREKGQTEWGGCGCGEQRGSRSHLDQQRWIHMGWGGEWRQQEPPGGEQGGLPHEAQGYREQWVIFLGGVLAHALLKLKL